MRKEDTSEDRSATNEECADNGGLNVSLRQVTEGSTQTGDEANAEADLAAPEANQALNSGNDVKLGQLGSAKGKVEGASTPMGVSTSQVRSAANGVAKGWLGMSLRQVTEGAAQTLNVRPDYGAFVANLNENSPAISAGIERGDIIINFDGKDIKDWRELPRSVADTPAGKEVMVTIIRKGKELTKVVKVGRPEDSDNRTSFTSMEASAPKEKQMRKNARGFDPAGSATLGRMTFGRRRATAVSQ